MTSAYHSLIGQELTIRDICLIRDRANAILFRQGVLARVEIVPQTFSISDSHVQLRIIASNVVSVQVKGDAGAAQAKVEDLVEHLRGMTPFDIHKAQRYLFLASDIPGISIQAALRPAPGGEGAVDLVITVQKKLVDGVINVENYNSDAMGVFGGLVRVDVNGLTALGERTSLIAYTSFDAGAQYVLQGEEDVRLGDNGLVGHLSFSYGDSHPGANLGQLRLDGQSYLGTLEFSYPLVRSRRADVFLSGGLDYINQTTTQNDGQSILSRDRLSVFYVQVSGRQDWRQQGWLPQGVVVGDLEFRQGADLFDASHAGVNNKLSRIEGQPETGVLRGDARMDLHWTSYFWTRIALSGQYTQRVLLAYEDFTVGNLSIGRGYDPSALTGDKGVSGSFESHVGPFPITVWRLPKTGPDVVQVSGFAFLDTAHVENLSTNGQNRTVRSIGGGFSTALNSKTYIDLFYAHPLDAVASTLSQHPHDRLFINLVARF